MFLFGKQSKLNLGSCNLFLQFLFRFVIKHRDCTILEGQRSEDRQNLMVKAGVSKVVFPNGKHNKSPADAADVGPYPLRWPRRLTAEQKIIVKEYARWYRFAGFVEGVAAVFGIPLRWGGDWDGDGDLTDQNFDDLPHFEVDSRKLPNDDSSRRGPAGT